MSPSMAWRPLAGNAPSVGARTRAWRPFPQEVADILCVEELAGDVRPRIHGRFGITLVRSPAVVRLESSRSVVVDRNWILLTPAWQLHALRARRGGVAHALVSLLLGACHLEGRRIVDRPALVADAELGAQVSTLVAQLRRPVHTIDWAITIRSVLERLIGNGTLVPTARFRRAGAPLGPVRDYLRDHLAEPVPIAALARLSGLTECHLIRAFEQEFGLPPHAYHMRLRLAAACELLSGGLSVSTAAYECGFADQSHLSRKFKEVYGLTPAAWSTSAADTPRHVLPPGALESLAWGASAATIDC